MAGVALQPQQELEIHALATVKEFTDAVRLQKEIWGFDDLELLPVRLFVVATKIGGQSLGAFDRGKMIAFSLCIPGLKPGGITYLHSHMLGVLPEYRNSGIGRRLKWKQRDFAIASGVDLIEWTFDPLELKNAFLNIERLGAIVRRYVRNQYGTTTSRLHGGLPTDRLIAEWWVGSKRVQAASQGKAAGPVEAEHRVSIPNDIAEVRRREPSEARSIQQRIGDDFEACFRRGLAVIGFERGPSVGTYLLGTWQSE
jgi:predicted GNAT superfamily acetyltransferase